tara:strand:- start:156 stop:458 length:303 start_codon:yes stop_codon:yes gene_type:complete
MTARRAIERARTLCWWHLIPALGAATPCKSFAALRLRTRPQAAYQAAIDHPLLYLRRYRRPTLGADPPLAPLAPQLLQPVTFDSFPTFARTVERSHALCR